MTIIISLLLNNRDFRECYGKQKSSHHLQGYYQDGDEGAFLITTLEAALLYIRNDGLAKQKYTTVYESGKSKYRRKKHLFIWSHSPENVTRSHNTLLKMFQLIENEDVESIKTLLMNWKISQPAIPHNRFIVSRDEISLKTQMDPSLCNKIEATESNTLPCDILPNSENENSSGIHPDHECHPLCLCNEAHILGTSPSTNQSLNFDATSISVILHSRDDLGRTSLHLASLVGNPLTVELLISHDDVGSSGLYRPTNCINCKDVYGMTPIHYASMKGHQNILLLLLHADADHNATDDEKNTALHMTANNGHESCVKALIYYSEHQSCPLDLNAQNLVGNTPLHMAAKWGFSTIVQILLSYDARYNISPFIL